MKQVKAQVKALPNPVVQYVQNPYVLVVGGVLYAISKILAGA
jgi:hypothetical protein